MFLTSSVGARGPFALRPVPRSNQKTPFFKGFQTLSKIKLQPPAPGECPVRGSGSRRTLINISTHLFDMAPPASVLSPNLSGLIRG